MRGRAADKRRRQYNNTPGRKRRLPSLAEYGVDGQVSDLEYDDTRLHQQREIGDTLICPQDNAADNDSCNEYDEVILFEQVRNPLDDPTPPQPTRIGVDEDSDWDGEIDFKTGKPTSVLITAAPRRLGAGDVLDNNTDKKGQTETGNTTVPTILQVNDAWKVLSPELVELNNRHSGELNDDRLIVRYTSNSPGAPRGLFAKKTSRCGKS